MGVDEFYDMLPQEFWDKLDGFYELENLRERNKWERARWSTCLLLNIHIGKNKKLKPTDLFEFEWEKENKKTEIKKLKNRAEYIKKLEEHGK